MCFLGVRMGRLGRWGGGNDGVIMRRMRGEKIIALAKGVWAF